CVDVDLDESGAATSDPTAAVLRPVDGYVSQLQAIAADKTAGRDVLVSVIAGVPLDYNLGGIEVSYADSEDPTFQALFGIGAGCSNPDTQQTAIPPVRLKSFAEAFAGDDINLYSVCDDDYTPAINDIVAGIEVELPPACFGGCVLDLDDSTEALDYSCVVTQRSGGKTVTLPECLDGDIPDGADACWVAKTGADLDPLCDVPGQNLEFELLRRPGVPVPGDVDVRAACELSAFTSFDCP
ncbi:MAG: hypothetical protein KC431_28565, partial [Myxococcales bacterium]|nr:hypothetical protein [Myxococcales bacterium]